MKKLLWPAILGIVVIIIVIIALSKKTLPTPTNYQGTVYEKFPKELLDSIKLEFLTSWKNQKGLVSSGTILAIQYALTQYHPELTLDEMKELTNPLIPDSIRS